MTFAQIVEKSKIYLKAAALYRAATDALEQFSVDPTSITFETPSHVRLTRFLPLTVIQPAANIPA